VSAVWRGPCSPQCRASSYSMHPMATSHASRHRLVPHMKDRLNKTPVPRWLQKKAQAMRKAPMRKAHCLLLLFARTEPCVGTSGPVADSTETTDNTSAAPSSNLEPPLKKRRAGELLQLQRAAQFKTCADALGTLGLQKVHTNNGGVNACLMYSFLLSSGKMHPNQQKIGCASHNLAPTWNVKLVCSQDRVLSRDAFYRANELRLEAYEILLASLPEHPTDVDPQHWSYGMSKERVCACHYDIRCACCACCKLSHVLTCLRCRQNGSMKRNAS
jgi:hypothetical protein